MPKKSKYNLSLSFIAFLQAMGILAYCGLVAIIFWKGNEWVGKVPNYIGPVLFLLLFSTSALVCAIAVGAYPFYLVWEKKQTKKAIQLVLYSAGWLIAVTLLILFIVAAF